MCRKCLVKSYLLQRQINHNNCSLGSEINAVSGKDKGFDRAEMRV